MTQVYKLLSKVINDLGKTICARVCDWFKQIATIGGVIANNASGMCCGTVENSYKTLESVSFLLPSGTHINTADADAEQQFALAEPELTKGLFDIKHEIEQDSQLVERMKKKFSIKNTTGYHMGAFIDASTPLEIFRRLLVGSEGTRD